METSELLKKVRHIEIKTRGLSRNIFAGQYHSAFKGRGMAFSYDIQNMLAALFGGYEFFYLIGKKYHTYLIVVLYSRECNSCSDFGHHLTFGLSYRSKISTGRDIDQNQ